MPTYQEIVDDATARRSDIIAQEKATQRQIGVVSHMGGPTMGQDIQSLTDTDDALITSREKLDLVTLQVLDQTVELKNIMDGLIAAVGDLTAATEKITKWGDIASEITSVLGGLSDLTAKIQTVVTAHSAAAVPAAKAK
jgi:hypothetical protein